MEDCCSSVRARLSRIHFPSGMRTNPPRAATRSRICALVRLTPSTSTRIFRSNQSISVASASSKRTEACTGSARREESSGSSEISASAGRVVSQVANFSGNVFVIRVRKHCCGWSQRNPIWSMWWGTSRRNWRLTTESLPGTEGCFCTSLHWSRSSDSSRDFSSSKALTLPCTTSASALPRFTRRKLKCGRSVASTAMARSSSGGSAPSLRR